jgi:general stress protein 26
MTEPHSSGIEPEASRPDIPYGLRKADEGLGLLPWSRVSERMRSSFVYWVATAGTGGRPHVIPVWGVWLDETCYFSNGATTRTGRNLAANSSVAVHLESGEDVVIIEGAVEPVTDAALIDRINDAYAEKYLWRERVDEGWYALRPEAAFAWFCPSVGLGAESVYAGSATRWRFGGR